MSVRLFVSAFLFMIGHQTLHGFEIIPWTTVPTGTTNALYSITYANGRFVAVGRNGDVISSIDASIWNVTNITDELDAVAGGSGVFIAANARSKTLFRSPDGLAWEKLDFSLITMTALRSLTFFKGNFLLMFWELGSGGDGHASIRSSTDGSQWQKSPEFLVGNVGRLRPFADKIYVTSVYTGGDDINPSTFGRLRVSSTGTNNWEIVSDFPEPIVDVMIAEGKMYVLGQFSIFLSEDQGQTWRSVAFHNQRLRNSFYGNGVFVWAGGFGTFATTTGGMITETAAGSIPNGMHDGIFDGTRFYMVGEAGALLVSPPIITIKTVTASQVELFGPQGPVEVQSASDVLGPWESFGQITIQQNPTAFSVSSEANRFYRVRQ